MARWWTAAVTLLAAVLMAAVPVEGSRSGTVIDVDAISLAKIIAKHKRPLLVEWYSPTCGHCVKLDPVLDELAAHYADQLTVVKIDSRSAGSLSSRYAVKATPTMVLFNGGKEVEVARKDLQGYRTFEALRHFLHFFIVPNPLEVSSVTELDPIVEDAGAVVLGLFGSEEDEGVAVFRNVSEANRGHTRFAISTSSALSQSLAEHFEVLEVPAVLALKGRNHTLQHSGSLKPKSVERFVKTHGYPLLGEFSVNTYYRYNDRPGDQTVLITNPEDRTKRARKLVKKSRDAVEHFATNHDDLTCMSTTHKASEADGKRVATKLGFAEAIPPPYVGFRTKDGKGSLAMNALVNVTKKGMELAYNIWSRPSDESRKQHRCMVSRGAARSTDYTSEVLNSYEGIAQAEKTRLMLSDDVIREVDMTTFNRQLKKSWKDVLIIYTARWCAHSTRLEEIFHRMVKAGEFEELNDELLFVKIDVVLTQPEDYKHLQTVPAVKYISARYKDFPNWYGGAHDDPDALVQFVHSYHSMRHVEIPGEGPSPYSSPEPKETEEERETLDLASDEIIF